MPAYSETMNHIGVALTYSSLVRDACMYRVKAHSASYFIDACRPNVAFRNGSTIYLLLETSTEDA